MSEYYYLLELKPEEAESRRIKIVRRTEIYVLPTNKEGVWCYVRFRPNDSEPFDVYEIETRIVENCLQTSVSEIETNCPLHSFDGNFCKEEFDSGDPCHEWRDHGKLHRLDGPAVVAEWSSTFKWYLHGVETDEESVKKARNEGIEEVIALI